MGLDHYLYRTDTLPPDRFTAWTRDVRRVLDNLPPTMIRGENGVGDPVITDELVAFNGNSAYAVPYADDPVAIYRDPVRLATYLVADEWQADKAHPFHVARVFDNSFRHENAQGLLFSDFRTAELPYDRAVVATLILFAHHFDGMCKVVSDHDYEYWRLGLALAREATGRDLYIPFYYRGWQRPRVLPADVFRAWRDDVAQVIAAAGVPLAGAHGTSEPMLTDELVAFNGVGADGEEPLHFSQVYDPTDGGGEGSDHDQLIGTIRTMGNAGKRYDIVVAAALLLLATHLPAERTIHDVHLARSGGVMLGVGGVGYEEWLPALQLAADATGRTMTMPRMWWS